jgi:hypothetical protein
MYALQIVLTAPSEIQKIEKSKKSKKLKKRDDLLN